MDAIIIAFAHSKEDPIPNLQVEYDRLVPMLYSDVRDKYSVIPIKYADKAEIGARISEVKEDLCVFLYSGHAGGEMLLLDDKEAGADGLKDLLAMCPKLQLVVLNGCNTMGQVDDLLELGVPAVIATNDVVDDEGAMRFSVELFKSLVALEPLEKAFTNAKAIAWADNADLVVHRGRRTKGENREDRSWGLHVGDNEQVLNWHLIDESRIDPNFVPNERLVKSLFDAIADHNELAREYKESEELMGIAISEADKAKAIFKALPEPIQRQVKRLVVVGDDSESNNFFNKVGLKRLEQLVRTYAVTTELLGVTFFSQLLQLLENDAQLEITDEEMQVMRSFLFKPEGDMQAGNYAALIRSIRTILSRHEVPYFIAELETLGEQYLGNEELGVAVDFFEKHKVRIRNKEVSENEARELCQTAEIHLSLFFSRLGFLANYQVLSIWDIDVYKYRFVKDVRYTYPSLGAALGPAPKSFIMDRQSVLLTKHEVDGSYLNLSPFMIDANAFVKGGSSRGVNRYMVIDKYDTDKDDYQYHEMHKPGRIAMRVSDMQGYHILKVQFEQLARLVFKKSISEL